MSKLNPLACPECGGMFHYRMWMDERQTETDGPDLIKCPGCGDVLGEHDTQAIGIKDATNATVLTVDVPDTDIDVPDTDVEVPDIGNGMARVSTELGNATVEVEAETAEKAERIHKRRWKQVMTDAENMAQAVRNEGPDAYQ